VHVGQHFLGAVQVEHLVTNPVRGAIFAAKAAHRLQHASAITSLASRAAAGTVAVERHAILAAVAGSC
jgi:hypothetical protein